MEKTSTYLNASFWVPLVLSVDKQKISSKKFLPQNVIFM